MMAFLIYDAKVAVALLVFYLFYRFLLKKETFHRFNRVVLVGTAVLSFLLPLCIITIHKPMEMAAPLVTESAMVAELPGQEPEQAKGRSSAQRQTEAQENLMLKDCGEGSECFPERGRFHSSTTRFFLSRPKTASTTASRVFA